MSRKLLSYLTRNVLTLGPKHPSLTSFLAVSPLPFCSKLIACSGRNHIFVTGFWLSACPKCSEHSDVWYAVVSLGAVCGGKPIPARDVCCNGTLHERRNLHAACCGSDVYYRNNHERCVGGVVINLKDDWTTKRDCETRTPQNCQPAIIVWPRLIPWTT